MPVKSKSRLSPSFPIKNAIKALNLPGFGVRILLYGGIFVNLLLPFYNFQSNSFAGWDNWTVEDDYSETRYIEAIINVQYEYYLKHGNFSDSLDGLAIGFIPEANTYTYRILSPMVPVPRGTGLKETTPNSESVVMVAQANYPFFSSYIAKVSAIPEKDSPKVWLTSGICEVPRLTSFPATMPTFVGKEIQCPKTTKTITVRVPQTFFVPHSDHQ